MNLNFGITLKKGIEISIVLKDLGSYFSWEIQTGFFQAFLFRKIKIMLHSILNVICLLFKANDKVVAKLFLEWF